MMTRVSGVAAVFFVLVATTVSAGPPEFDGDGGGDVAFGGTEIRKVDGKGNWVLRGNGQDLTIIDKKDGPGSLTLENFRNVTIREKNGTGTLIVAPSCVNVFIGKVDGDGNVVLRNRGSKRVGDKNGKGEVVYQGEPPSFGKKDGPGISRKE